MMVVLTDPSHGCVLYPTPGEDRATRALYTTETGHDVPDTSVHQVIKLGDALFDPRGWPLGSCAGTMSKAERW